MFATVCQLAALLLAAPLVSAAYDKTACNNSPALCKKSYADIWHLGTHNSPFLRNSTNNFSLSGNQYFNVTTQLDAGVRLLQGQVHNEGGVARLCHSSCGLFDAGTLTDYLATVEGWMQTHPSEVITILLVNSDNLPPSTLKFSFESSKLSLLSYTPPSSPMKPSQWPTLQALITNNTRVITFLSTSADTSSVPYLLPEFESIFETAFEITNPANYTCSPDRPTGLTLEGAVNTRMGLANRFLYQDVIKGFGVLSPNSSYAATLNADSGVGNLKAGIASCGQKWNVTGGFVLVDFFNEGPAIAQVDAANNLTSSSNRVNPPNTPTAEEQKTSTSSSSSGGSNGKKNSGYEALKSLVRDVVSGNKTDDDVDVGQWIYVVGDWTSTITGDLDGFGGLDKTDD